MELRNFTTRVFQSIRVGMPIESVVVCKRILYRNGLNLQELFSQMLEMLERNDPRILAVIEEAKKNKIANGKRSYVDCTPASLYATMSADDPLKTRTKE